MKSLFDPAARTELTTRLHTLTPDKKPQWGRLDAPRMVVHLTDTCRMARGELPVAAKKLPIRFFPLNYLIVYYAPFPKGAPTAPELLARPPAQWDVEARELAAEIERFASLGPGDRWPPHPAFGTLSGRAWGVLMYRHIDHHFRQFGV